MLSLSGVLLVFVLALTGGTIAFVGDRLGLRVGKKRLSLFGLRPRYTSMLIAILTGMIITITTIALLSIVSVEVRTALFGLEELTTTLATQKAELEVKEKNLMELSELIDRTTKELQEIDAQRVAALNELNEADAKLKELNEAYDAVSRELQEKETLLQQKTSELQQAEARVDVLKEVEQRLTATIEETTKAKEYTEEFLDRLYGGYILYQADEIVYNTVVSGSDDTIEKLLYEAVQIADTLAFQKGARSDQRAFQALRVVGDDLNSIKDIAKVASENPEGVFRIVAWGNTVVGAPLACYFEYVPRTMIYKQGEVLTEIVLQPNSDQQRVFEAIATMLTDFGIEARTRGMLVGDNGKVVDVPVRSLQEAIDKASNQSIPVKIRALATRDIITTEYPIYCELEVILELPENA